MDHAVLASVDLPAGFRIVSASTHPHLSSRSRSLAAKLFPAWLDSDSDKLVPLLYEVPEFMPYQLSVLKRPDGFNGDSDESWDDAEVIGHARTVPFHWSRLEESGVEFEEALKSLPDNGWEGIIQLAMSQLSPQISIKEKQFSLPMSLDTSDLRLNALAGLAICVRPEYRSLDLANILIQTLRAVATHHQIKVFAIPLRPTRKSSYPHVPMEKYITWDKDHGSSTMVDSGILIESEDMDEKVPFDPWIRKHWRLGARVIKVAPQSYVVERDLSEWSQLLGVDFAEQIKGRCPDGVDDERGEFFRVTIPGGLVPVDCYPTTGKGVYIEPNVWIYHRLSQ